jgi:hypothetical protein
MGAPEKLAFMVALVVFAGGAAGLILQRLLSEEFTTGASGPRAKRIQRYKSAENVGWANPPPKPR